MPKGQRRAYGKGELHFITSVCFQRQPKLADPKHRALFLQLLEQIAAKFAWGFAAVSFLVPNRFEYGYGLTPEIVELARTRDHFLDPALR